MATIADDLGEDGPTGDRVDAPGGRRWPTVGLGVVALLVFEITTDPGIALAVGCSKFGWDRVRTSRWLLRHDPDPIRGRVCSRFYLAAALWKISMAAIASLLVIGCVAGLLARQIGRGAGPPPAVVARVIVVDLLIVAVALFLSGCVSALGVASALRHGVRVWVGRGRNRAKVILLSVLLPAGLSLAGLGTLLVLWIGRRVGPVPEAVGLIGLAALMVLVYVVVPVGTLKILDHLDRRIVARTPADCGVDWPGRTSPWRL